MLNDRELRALAAECGVPVEDVCSTCGRLVPQGTAAHFGHAVSRLRAPRPRLVEWLTVGEIATELGLSKMTVYRLVNSGSIAGHRFGGSVRVARAALVAYMLETRIRPGELDDDEDAEATA